MATSAPCFGNSIQAASGDSPGTQYLPTRRSIVPATFVTSLVVLVSASFHHDLFHWFLIPTALCGVLIGPEAFDWFRGRTGLFDPSALMSLLGYHFFFVAPILMITTEWRMKYLSDQPSDYRDYLGAMACLNLAGILLYRMVLSRRLKTAMNDPTPLRIWRIDPLRFWPTFTVLILASIVSQAYIFRSFGGFSGYIDSYTSAIGGNDQFQGASLLFSVGESLPILLAIAFAVWARKRSLALGPLLTVILMLGILQFLCGGLRGSRSNVIWSLFWIAGVVNNYVRRLPPVVAYVGIAALYLFVSVYAAYKQQGSHLLDSFASSGDYSALSEDSEGPAAVLVGDFSRTDVQSYLFYKQAEGLAQEPALGATYLGAITMIVPKTLWPTRPPTILKWTTDAEYGNGAYNAGMMLSSRVYGIAGEAMLNFGPPGVLLAYTLLGALVATLQFYSIRLASDDVRRMVIPFLSNLLFVVLLNDSDNAIFYFFKYGLVPLTLLFVGSRSVPVSAVSIRSRIGRRSSAYASIAR